jgi:DEAD/DEAH box helicase domain-containing protein
VTHSTRLFGGETISEHPLTAPPLVFETIGFWIDIPGALPAVAAARELHFMGGIHAAEHAMIGLYPLLAIADRGDVGGISYTGHPQTGGPAVFLYDGVAGGAGLAEAGFRDLDALLRRTLDHVAACPCEAGCPSCIQSPRCGNGNKPLDKTAARLVLGVLVGDEPLEDSAPAPPARPLAVPVRRKHGITRALPASSERVLFFDVETQRSAEEVGGWTNVGRMGLALAVVYDGARESFKTYYETDVEKLLLDLVMADRVVGFNIDRFDLAVLAGYTEWSLGRIRTLDLLADLYGRIRFRPSLRHLTETNLGEPKSADGIQSLRWWKEGRIDLIEEYCRKDVDLTRRLYELGKRRGYLLLEHREGRVVRVPVSW